MTNAHLWNTDLRVYLPGFSIRNVQRYQGLDKMIWSTQNHYQYFANTPSCHIKKKKSISCICLSLTVNLILVWIFQVTLNLPDCRYHSIKSVFRHSWDKTQNCSEVSSLENCIFPQALWCQKESGPAGCKIPCFATKIPLPYTCQVMPALCGYFFCPTSKKFNREPARCVLCSTELYLRTF